MVTLFLFIIVIKSQALVYSLLDIIKLTNMTERKSRKVDHLDSETPTIISIKHILSRIKDEISMRTVTVAIRQHCIEQNYQDRDILLSFFLYCQSRLRKHNNHQWNRVIQGQIKKMVGLDLLNHFAFRKWGKKLIDNLLMGNMDSKQQIESRLCEQYGELQISEDIRLQTKYFFKWAQFLEERREIKRLKNKEVEDIKKSRVFNQYSIKFQSFMKWKQHTRRIHVCKEKAKIIELSSVKRLLTGAFDKVKEKIQILNIEGKLEQVVIQRMKDLRIKEVFAKLKTNKANEQRIAANLRINQNIWVYRFYGFITRKMHSTLQKSAIESRQNLKYQYQQLCLRQCFKGLKKQTLQQAKKISLLKLGIKTLGFREFCRINSSKKHNNKCRRQLIIKLKLRNFLDFVECVEENNQLSLQFQQKIKKIRSKYNESIYRSFLKTFGLIKITRQNLHSKLAKLNTKMIKFQKQQFLANLVSKYKQKKSLIEKKTSLRAYHLAYILKARYNKYNDYKNDKEQLKKELRSRHEIQLKRSVVKGLKEYKKIKVTEHDALIGTFKTIELKLLGEAFSTIKARLDMIRKLTFLAKRSEWAMVKVSFITILNKMLSNKMKIKNYYHNQELKLKSMLFEMLKSNSHHIQSQIVKVREVVLAYDKITFISSLKKEAKMRRKVELAERVHEISEKRKLYSCLQQQKQINLRLEQKQFQLIRCLLESNFINFTNSSSSLIQYRQQQARKIYKCHKNMVKTVFRKLKKHLKEKRQYQNRQEIVQSVYKQKIQQIQSKIAFESLTKLIRLNQSTLDAKYQRLVRIKFIHMVKFLQINKNKSQITGLSTTKIKIEVLRQLQIHKEIIKKGKKLSKLLKKNIKKIAINITFFNCLDAIKERDWKQNQLKRSLQQSREISSRSKFVSRLKNHYELLQNRMILSNYMTKQYLGQLVKSYLREKSKSIKDLISMRLYATNLKKRAMRAMKLALEVNVLQENRVRTEQHSKLSMQKSIDHARRKSKLLETIERYNLSRVSRVIR